MPSRALRWAAEYASRLDVVLEQVVERSPDERCLVNSEAGESVAGQRCERKMLVGRPHDRREVFEEEPQAGLVRPQGLCRREVRRTQPAHHETAQGGRDDHEKGDDDDLEGEQQLLDPSRALAERLRELDFEAGQPDVGRLELRRQRRCGRDIARQHGGRGSGRRFA